MKGVNSDILNSLSMPRETDAERDVRIALEFETCVKVIAKRHNVSETITKNVIYGYLDKAKKMTS